MTQKILPSFLLSFAFVISAGLFSSAAAQTTLTGDWSAKPASKDDSKINLNFERGSEKGGKHQIGQTFEYSQLQGLTREQVMNGGPVKFSLVREAGTVECEGSFQNQKGSGTFRFTGNQAFVAAMKSRGFDFEKESTTKYEDHQPENRLFAATTLNVTTALADDLSSSGFTLDVGDLFKAAIFKIDSAFMREMKATGFPNLDMDDLVKARIFHIDAEFVRQAAHMGFDKQPFEHLVKMSIFKITPQFVAGVRDEGLTNLSIEDVVKLKIFNIDAEAIRKAKAEGVPLNVERLVQWRLGVSRAPSRRVI
jgi:hypothetical protein